MDKPTYPIEIFYDGSCAVCAAEMDFYRRRNPDGKLRFVDISAEDFDPARYGPDHDEFMQQLHVRDAQGSWYLAVEGFRAIWQAYPPKSLWGMLARLVSLPGVDRLARLGYRIFARYRHLLPKREKSCPDGTCPVHQKTDSKPRK